MTLATDARPDSDAVSRKMRRAAAKAEHRMGDGAEVGGTGYTILKLRASPIAFLADHGRIGGEELQAVEDIEVAFLSLSGGLLARSGTMDRIDRSQVSRDPAFVIDAVRRYQRWANHWSDRAKRGDPTLAITISAVIDGRPFKAIERDVEIGHGRAQMAVIGGLRDYAARAGWVTRREGRGWMDEAASLFRLKKFLTTGSVGGLKSAS